MRDRFPMAPDRHSKLTCKLVPVAWLLISLTLVLSRCSDEEPLPTPIPITIQLSVLPSGPEVEMAYIPAGDFTMGTTKEQKDILQAWANEQGKGVDPTFPYYEQPVHTIYLDAFWIDRTEVTNAQFAAFVEATKYVTTAEKEGFGWIIQEHYGSGETQGADWKHPKGPDSDLNGMSEHPVVLVSWDDAAIYCDWRGARLPTEAEWEKAARGPNELIYPWGNEFDCSKGNFNDWSNVHEHDAVDSGPTCDGFTFTAPVASYPSGASPYGVMDMAGNVREWVSDWYSSQYYGESPGTNPAGPRSGENRILRGGSWLIDREDNRSANRWWRLPSIRTNDLGFRCVTTSP